MEQNLGVDSPIKSGNDKRESRNDKREKEPTVWYALGLAWQLGYTIAIPLVVLALAGRFLDKKFGASPWLLLVGILVSLVMSSWLVYLKIIKILAESERKTQSEKRKITVQNSK